MARTNRGLTSYRLAQPPEMGLKVFSVRKLLLADIKVAPHAGAWIEIVYVIKTIKQIAPFKLLPVGRYAAMCMHTYTIAITQFREGAYT